MQVWKQHVKCKTTVRINYHFWEVTSPRGLVLSKPTFVCVPVKLMCVPPGNCEVHSLDNRDAEQTQVLGWIHRTMHINLVSQKLKSDKHHRVKRLKWLSCKTKLFHYRVGIQVSLKWCAIDYYLILRHVQTSEIVQNLLTNLLQPRRFYARNCNYDRLESQPWPQGRTHCHLGIYGPRMTDRPTTTLSARLSVSTAFPLSSSGLGFKSVVIAITRVNSARLL